MFILYRQVKKVNTLLVYNVNGKVWFPVSASAAPKPTAYHSSVLMGDHMILYGKLNLRSVVKTRDGYRNEYLSQC